FFASREKEFYKNLGWQRIMYGGVFFKMWGAFQVYVGLKNYEEALRHHLQVIQDGKDVCIFPSGKRILRGEPLKAKGGVSFLARETQLPIMPVLIRGAEPITLRNFFTRTQKLSVTFGKPIFVQEIFTDMGRVIVDDQKNDYEIASATLMERIMQLA
ncbi:MAG: lysophospholipid acyltransferase family protein, partial [Ktedonobacteraceae bacterium]